MSKNKATTSQPEVEPAPFQRPFKVATLSRARPYQFDLSLEGEEAVSIASFLRIPKVSGLRFKGTLSAQGDDEWRIEGRLTTSATQECVVTLSPVDQKVDEKILREYVPETNETIAKIDLDPDSDDEPEIFTDVIDPGQLAIEVLALALDPYPRAEDAKLDATRFAPPGVAPLSDNDLKPFAGLAALKEKMERDDN
ncbi:MAG: DUF177 domain-containing protein [Pseudomonadota bacterium]